MSLRIVDLSARISTSGSSGPLLDVKNYAAQQSQTKCPDRFLDPGIAKFYPADAV
jgi:hypothetical protein